MGNEILARSRYFKVFIFTSVVLGWQDLLMQFCCVFAFEGLPASQHEVYYTTDTPQVYLFVVRLILEHFWGLPLFHPCFRHHWSFTEFLWHIEVYNFDFLEVFRDNEIIWFKISMAYVLLVKILNTFQYLFSELFRFRFYKSQPNLTYLLQGHFCTRTLTAVSRLNIPWLYIRCFAFHQWTSL